jgi:sarcosine oxidase
VRHGATVHSDEALLSWRASDDGVEVTTTQGTYSAARLVLTVGAWASMLLRELELPFVVQRNVLYWFAPASHPEWFSPARCPVFIHEIEPGLAWYGFPDTGDGVKLALHHHGEVTHPDRVERTVAETEVRFIRGIIDQYMPGAGGPLLDTAACMYTNLPDDHFLIDVHPDAPSVIVASPCSGHGFKFSSALGEVLADMATGRTVSFDTSLFSLSRFASR